MFVAYGIGLTIEALRPAETKQSSANIQFNFTHGFFFVPFNSITLSVVAGSQHHRVHHSGHAQHKDKYF